MESRKPSVNCVHWFLTVDIQLSNTLSSLAEDLGERTGLEAATSAPEFRAWKDRGPVERDGLRAGDFERENSFGRTILLANWRVIGDTVVVLSVPAVVTNTRTREISGVPVGESIRNLLRLYMRLGNKVTTE